MKKSAFNGLFILIAALSLSVTACGGSSNTAGGADKDHTYSFWLPQGEDSSYYTSYEENPVIEFMMTKMFKGEDGKDTKINVNFEIPASGSAEKTLTTTLATGEYTDVIDMTIYKGSIQDLYNEGIVQDMTPYIEKYMPNYLAYLDKNPDLKLTASMAIDGEKKYLQLYQIAGAMASLGTCFPLHFL